MALSPSRMAIGLAGEALPGAVEIYERAGATGWVLVDKVSASDAEYIEEFGYSVAINEEVLVVGAVHSGLLAAKGAAYVFERQLDGTWTEIVKLEPPHTDAWGFGWDVALDGDRFVVGAKGASSLGGGFGMAFVYEREGGAWVHKATVHPSLPWPGDGFGNALDLEGERLVVGASHQWAGTSGDREGLAFVFERSPSGTGWPETAVLSPPDLGTYDRFGESVSLDGDRILVGAPGHLIPGAAYLFDLVDGTWVETAKFDPLPGTGLMNFGRAVGLQGSRAFAGTPRNGDVAPYAGAVYPFEEVAGEWVSLPKLHPASLEEGDAFGYSLDLLGDELLVGAPIEGVDYFGPGRAFLFDLAPDGPSLTADAASLSLGAGGAQGFQLAACTEHAGDLFLLAGSATGTAPGFAFAGQAVPLNPDAYFFHTVNHVGAGPLSGALGVFDADGRGYADFELPAGYEPSLAGLLLNHAFAVLDASTLQVEAVSKAVPLALVP